MSIPASSPLVQSALDAVAESDSRMNGYSPAERAALEREARLLAASPAPFEPTATYLGCWDMRNEPEIAESHRRIIHMFNLVRPLGVHPVGSTVTAETLRELGVVVPEDLTGWEKERVV